MKAHDETNPDCKCDKCVWTMMANNTAPTPAAAPCSAPALPRLVRPFRSDRKGGRKPFEKSVILKTLCTKCQSPMECHWPAEMTFDGVECTAAEYMAKALQSDSVGIYCDDCLEKMPDVKLEDLRHE